MTETSLEWVSFRDSGDSYTGPMPAGRTIRGVGVVALLAGSLMFASPAKATIYSEIEFIASMELSGPIGVQCAPNTSWLPCPANPTVHTALPLLVGPPHMHVNWGGHTRTIVQWSASLCENEVVYLNKPNSSPATTGPCGVSPAPGKPPEGNHLHGYCELNGGQFQLFLTDATGATFLLDIHFNTASGSTLLIGTWVPLSGILQVGLLWGKLHTLPIPADGQSCANSTARTFNFAGVLTLAGV